MNKKQFIPGADIALKIPKYKYEETAHFYENVLQLRKKEVGEKFVAFAFGEFTLWIDCMDNYSQSDVWLEVFSTEVDLSVQYFEEHQVPRRDEIEEQRNGFWISDPAGTIIRVGKSEE